MERTPKIQRKASLSLGNRINNKRHHESPQTRMHAVQAAFNSANNVFATATTPRRSPSALSICSDGGIECTPPHKKFSLDDSLDYSPRVLDSSFSPSCMLSQTLATDSTEVDWKWNRGLAALNDETSATTPDSAYAADSSFTSAGSSSTEAANVRTRSEAQRHRLANDKRREEHRKTMEQQQRKAEKQKMDQMLKKRCAKFQEQLKEAQTNAQKQMKEEEMKPTNELPIRIESPVPVIKNRVITSAASETNSTQISTTTSSVTSTVASTSSSTKDCFSDFFNDSDSDCLLLQATQEFESKIDELTQKTVLDKEAVAHKSPPATTTTPKSSTKEKRSSMYSKFLDDDSADDWFVSLDEVILQAMQPQKPRASFQRYKSMPADTMTTTTAGTVKESAASTTASSATLANLAIRGKAATTGNNAINNLKRHASSNTLSPSSSSYKGHLHNRKK